jgi:biopolymer transport protein ExbD
MFFRRKSDEGVGIAIPITPMLDMAFQLLTFFIFTYHPSEMEGQMKMAMAAGPVVGNPGEARPVDEPVDGLSGSAVVVRVRTQQGQDSGGIVYPIEVDADVAHGVAHSVGDLEKYLTELRTSGQLLGKRGATIESDRRLKWAFVVDVMDACQRSGLTVSLATPPDGK